MNMSKRGQQSTTRCVLCSLCSLLFKCVVKETHLWTVCVSDPLLPKERRSPAQLARIRIEAKASIERIGGDLFLGNLERQFAAVELSSLRLDRFKQSSPHTASLPLLEHMEIVNVEERSRRKRRETKETRGDSNRPIAVEGQQDERRRMRSQALDQFSLHVLGKIRTAADRVSGIGARQLEDGRSMVRVIQIGLNDSQTFNSAAHFGTGRTMASFSLNDASPGLSFSRYSIFNCLGVSGTGSPPKLSL